MTTKVLILRFSRDQISKEVSYSFETKHIKKHLNYAVKVKYVIDSPPNKYHEYLEIRINNEKVPIGFGDIRDIRELVYEILQPNKALTWIEIVELVHDILSTLELLEKDPNVKYTCDYVGGDYPRLNFEAIITI